MLRLRNLRNKYQKRLIRPLYAQTQATPYAAVLDDTLRGPSGDFVFTANSFKYKGGLVPGTVMTNVGDKVKVHTGTDPAAGFAGQTPPSPRAFGLLANFVGGDLDDLGDENYVGVWRGPDSVYEILAPGFAGSGTGAGTGGGDLLTAWTAAVTAGVGNVPLYAGPDGRLTHLPVAGNREVVAYLIERPTVSRIVVDLKV